MTLSSGIYKRFKKLFVLDDDGLRRLEGVLTKAAATYTEPLKVTFRVEREDDRFYETHDISEVLSDPNVAGHRVKLLGIELRKTTSSEQSSTMDEDRVAWIIFDKDDPPLQTPDVRVRISCPDKTWALMLADEIEPQITRLFRVKVFPNWVFLLFAPIVGFLAYRGSLQLGFPIQRAVSHGTSGAIYFAAACFALHFYNKLIAEQKLGFLRVLSAEPVFLWGEEVTNSADREALRKNILWVIIVGFFVSLVAGAATLLL